MIAKQCLKVELTIPQIETIIEALHQQNYSLRCDVMNELSKQPINSQKDYNQKLEEILKSSVSYQLEAEFVELLEAIKGGVIL